MSETKVITGKVRFSYAHVFEPKAITEGQDAKYSVSLIISKDDKATIAKIENAIKAATEEGKAKFGGKIPPKLKLPLRDGDIERPDDEAYQNSFFINVNSNSKPGIVGTQKDDFGNLIALTPDEFYSGCWGRASVTFYPFNTNGNKGIACGLNNLQKLEDGIRLAGGSNAQEDFGEDNAESLM